MGEAYDRAVAALPALSPSERLRIASGLRMLESLAPGQVLAAPGELPEKSDDDALDLLGAIADVVLRTSGERVSPVALRRSSGFPAFRAKAGELEAFAVKHAPARAQRRALLAVGVELLYRDLARAGFSVTSRTLMACVHQVPAVLDKNFPGYAASGLLGMVIGRRGEHERNSSNETGT